MSKQISTGEVRLQPEGKILTSKPKWSVMIASPYLAVIAIYSSGNDVLFVLSAVAAGLLTFALITAWFWLTYTVTLGKDYVKVRNGWRIRTFHPSQSLAALRVRNLIDSDNASLFLGDGRKKAMILTLSNQQLDLIVQRLSVIPEETEIARASLLDLKTLSDKSVNTLPFWMRHPVGVGLIIGFALIALIIAGVFIYFILTDQHFGSS